ncbi:MAG: release factor glutamine methyltransferase [Gammaproteobacteria bacterium]|jgi:release factor glutamine methyltransferase
MEVDYQNKGLSLNDIQELKIISQGNNSLFKRIVQRRSFGEPMDYIRGEIEFYGRLYKINRNTYIPDTQTEQLVKLFLKNVLDGASVVDVGTGTGNIAITLVKENPSLKVLGCDIYPPALELARFNAERHKVNIPFIESNYVDDLHITAPNYIIADLPWGNEEHYWEDNDKNLIEHMPCHACFHPEGILNSYLELFESISENKKWSPIVYFESGLITKKQVEQFFPKDLSFEYVTFENYSVTIVDLC